MLNDTVGFSEIYIVCGRTDLRYGIDSLAGVLRSLGIENPATAGRFTCSAEEDLTGSRGLYGKVMDFSSCTRNLQMVHFSGRAMQAKLKV